MMTRINQVDELLTKFERKSISQKSVPIVLLILTLIWVRIL